MTPRDDEHLLPEMLVVVASVEDATALAPLAAVEEVVTPVLVATGPEPMEVDLALDDLGARAGRVLLLDGPCGDPAGEVARMLPRLVEALTPAGVAVARPDDVADPRADDGGDPGIAAVVVRGGSTAALAAAQAAAWRGVPVLAVDDPTSAGADPVQAANRAAIGGLTAWQASDAGVAHPARLDLLVQGCLDAARGRRVVRMPVTKSAITGLTA